MPPRSSNLPKVWNKRHRDVPKDAVYVGRPSRFGNPYSHLPLEATKASILVDSREEAVQRYREMVLTHEGMIKDIKATLRGKDLVCWCAPAACHADVLLEIANTEEDT